jgi:poly-gamma-glutamate system protein
MISSKRLAGILFLSIASLAVIETAGVKRERHPAAVKMSQAMQLSERWMESIDSAAAVNQLQITSPAATRHTGILGVEWSEITTTLGSEEAKELSTNPLFASLVLRYLVGAGIDSNATVGVALSGSFPGLAISTLAALQILGAKAVIISSIGASSFGANRPELTWLDMENILSRKAGLRYHSEMITFGAEGDSGAGLFENGKELLLEAAKRNNVRLVIPQSFRAAIDRRMEMFDSMHISLLINIGGNHAMIGNCPHGESLPYGFHRVLSSCYDCERGVIVRLAERGVPVLHFLHIRAIASQYQINSPNPAIEGDVFTRTVYQKPLVVVTLCLLLASIIAAGKKLRE